MQVGPTQVLDLADMSSVNTAENRRDGAQGGAVVQEARSGKQEAGSRKRGAGSRKRGAGSGKREKRVKGEDGNPAFCLSSPLLEHLYSVFKERFTFDPAGSYSIVIWPFKTATRSGNQKRQ